MDTRAPNKAEIGTKLLNGASQPPKNNKLRLSRKLSFGKQGACSSTGQKCHHFTRSKSAHMMLEVEDLNTASPCRASSSSLGFTSFTGFMATPERIIDTDQKEFADNDTSDIDLEVPRQRKVMGERTPPIYLKFADVKLKVVTKGIGSNTEKEIVKKISGSASPGEFLAFMGPSGSGKTSMLNLLGGRISNNHLVDGYITYNDKPYSKSLKRRIGFVTQDDILYAHLSVKETLTYTALLRLPKTMTRRHKEERVMDVIYELGLDRCQDTMIGGAAVRGVSGGERKRVCIGNEIIINPSLLFLDEPTSGLDSTTALKVVQMLHQIAEGGKTVVSTIHQPSSRMFHKFDKLVVLGKGRLLYFGQASEVTTYFSSLGFSPLLPMNPAEFLLDLANGNTNDISVPLELKNKVQVEKLTSEVQSCFNPSPKHVHEYLVEAYETGVAPQLRKQLVTPIPFQPDLRGPRREWEASWWQQFSVLFIRGLKERKHDYLSWMRISQVLATAIILGLLWWHSDSSTPKGLQDQVGLLFFIALFWGFIPVSTAIFTFPQERAVINKERAVDMYRLSAYFMARTASDLPLDLLLPLVFVTISYFMAGLRLGVAPFFLTILTVFLNIITAQGLGLAIGAALSDIKMASTLASVTVMTFMLTGGFFLKNVPPFLSWVRYLSFIDHTYRLLLKLQYDRVPTYIDGSGVGNGIKEVVLMVSMIFVYRVLAYIFLRIKLPNF